MSSVLHAKKISLFFSLLLEIELDASECQKGVEKELNRCQSL